jgi:hypothetical protein
LVAPQDNNRARRYDPFHLQEIPANQLGWRVKHIGTKNSPLPVLLQLYNEPIKHHQ